MASACITLPVPHRPLGGQRDRSWSHRSIHRRRNWTTKIVADKVVFLGGRDAASQGQGSQGYGNRRQEPEQYPGGEPSDENVPF